MTDKGKSDKLLTTRDMENNEVFTREAFWLIPQEYAKIYSEINQIYEAQYKDKPIAAHTSFGIDGKAYVYWFENLGFNKYNIFLRVLDDN